MTGIPRMEFGYNPPSGERDLEVIRPREYLGDLHRSLDAASQSFTSFWVSDTSPTAPSTASSAGRFSPGLPRATRASA